MIRIIAVGKIKEDYLVKMIEDYCKRINKYHKLEIVELADDNKKSEGERILKKIANGFNIALAIDGKEYSSLEFAKHVDQTLMNYANINFIIGGSDGLADEVYEKVSEKLSFSKLTFAHGMFRAILLEQIYRGFKILNNESYHK